MVHMYVSMVSTYSKLEAWCVDKYSKRTLSHDTSSGCAVPDNGGKSWTASDSNVNCPAPL